MKMFTDSACWVNVPFHKFSDGIPVPLSFHETINNHKHSTNTLKLSKTTQVNTAILNITSGARIILEIMDNHGASSIFLHVHLSSCGSSPESSFFMGFSLYKPSILGWKHLWKKWNEFPYMETQRNPYRTPAIFQPSCRLDGVPRQPLRREGRGRRRCGRRLGLRHGGGRRGAEALSH